MSYQLKDCIKLWGCVQYVNSLPFRLKTLYENSSDITPVLDTPKNLVNSFIADELDVVLTSSVCHFLTGAPYIPGLGIAAVKTIYSVNLYAKPKFFSSNTNSTIGVIQDSVSSTTLIQILAAFYWKIPIQIQQITSKNPNLNSQYDGLLLIGDSALQYPKIPGYVTYDLACEWYKFTKLPFVFALFLIRNNLPIEEFRKILEDSLDFSRNNKSLLIQTAKQYLPESSEVMLKKYYKSCIYKLGTNEMKGFDKFQEFYEQLPKN